MKCLSNPILTKEQLGAFIDKSIESLNAGDGTSLNELATLMQTLALVTNDSVFFALPQSIGSYASELGRFRMLVAFPILGEEDRSRCKKCIDDAIADGAKALVILKKELFGTSNPDSSEILKAMAIFSKRGYNMYTLRNQFTAVPGGSRATQEE